MGLILSCFRSCCCKRKTSEYKKLDTPSLSPCDDIEGGGAVADDDWEEDFEDPEMPEPEPEPEPDPFADFGMAPQIQKTRKHNAPSVFGEKSVPTSSRFAMAAADETDSGGGWGGELDDLPEVADGRRQAAEQRRQQRRAERGGTEQRAPRLKVAATRAPGRE